MKRGIFYVLLLLLKPALFSQNLVVNPGLETWIKSNKPAGWNISVNCLKDSSTVYSGLYSCRHSSTVSDTKNLGQTIEVIPGKNYRFSFYFKTEVIGTEHGCRIWCDWKDAGGNSVSDAPTKLILQPSSYMKSDSWQMFSIDITAPVNAANFTLELRTYQSSIAYYDDFVFEENIPTKSAEEQFPEITIFPNPVHEYLNIRNIHDMQFVSIQSLTGITVWTSSFSGEKDLMIPLSGFPEGIYIIRIRTSASTIIKKIIKR